MIIMNVNFINFLPVITVAVFFNLKSRPFGVALLFGGLDEKGPQL